MAKIGCLKPFRGTASALANVVLEDGEIAFETTNKCIYMGNGVDTVSNLDPFLGENINAIRIYFKGEDQGTQKVYIYAGHCNIYGTYTDTILVESFTYSTVKSKDYYGLVYLDIYLATNNRYIATVYNSTKTKTLFGNSFEMPTDFNIHTTWSGTREVIIPNNFYDNPGRDMDDVFTSVYF